MGPGGNRAGALFRFAFWRLFPARRAVCTLSSLVYRRPNVALPEWRGRGNTGVEEPTVTIQGDILLKKKGAARGT